MKIGICVNSFPCSPEEQFEFMARYGFEATFCDALTKHLETVMALSRQYNIPVENFHAPFDHINDIWLDIPGGVRMLDELLQSVDNCQRYGVPTLVVHLSSGDRPPCINPLGMERFAHLIAYAKSCGVQIAFENQRKLANLAFAFEEFEDAVFCWDTGHEKVLCLMDIDFMSLFGNRLGALHIHDNHCVHNADEHRIPGDGLIDFDCVADKIAKTDYQGSVMLELIAQKSPDYLEMGADAFYQRAAEAARRLRDNIEKKR